MTFLDYFKLALTSLWAHKIRSLLTTVGVILGVAAVITMVGISEGARIQVISEITKLGINNILVRSIMSQKEEKGKSQEQDSWYYFYGATLKDASHIEEILKDYVSKTAIVRDLRKDIYKGKNKTSIKTLAVTPEYFEIVGAKLKQGRLFDFIDDENADFVCILGHKAKKTLFRYKDPLSKDNYIRVEDFYCKVIGVLFPKKFSATSIQTFDIDNALFIPYNAFKTRLGTTTYKHSKGKSEYIRVEADEVWINLKDTKYVEPAGKVIARIMEKAHPEQDYEVFVPIELLKQKEKTQRTFTIVMISIAAIALLVGGIGIMNIMLTSVLERTREIGTRRALGASKIDVLNQFLMEAVTLSTSGGIIGILFGIGLTTAISYFADWKTVITIPAVAVAFGISALCGIVFGTYPAYKAANLDPIEAIRYE